MVVSDQRHCSNLLPGVIYECDHPPSSSTLAMARTEPTIEVLTKFIESMKEFVQHHFGESCDHDTQGAQIPKLESLCDIFRSPSGNERVLAEILEATYGIRISDGPDERIRRALVEAYAVSVCERC